MEFGLSDSSGTDDDLPPSHKNRLQQPDHIAGNGRSAAIGSSTFTRMQNDMETQIHNIEQEAYTSVLRAFKAQSDAITWEKESLITELRKELRVSDEEHRVLLSRVNVDDIIRRIREWRKASGLQPATVNNGQSVDDRVPSPNVSASCKKQKTSHSVASLSLGAPSPVVRPPIPPSSSLLRHGPPSGAKTKKPKPFLFPGITNRNQVINRGGSSCAVATNEPAGAASYDPLIGRRVWTRWPDDSHFYEAVITDYNAAEGRHALVYDMNSANETWEWVNLKEIPPEDISWEGEDPGIPHKGGRPGSGSRSGRGMKKSVPRGTAFTGAGKGRGITKVQPKKDFALSQNGSRKKPTGDIEILHTDTLIKQVERVFGASHPDPVEMEKAKKVLKEHEQALVNAIARLGDASDGESDGEPPFSQGHSRDQETGWKKWKSDNVGGVRVLEGSNLPIESSAPSEYQHS